MIVYIVLLDLTLVLFLGIAVMIALVFSCKILHEVRRNPALRQGDRQIGFVVSVALANTFYAVTNVVRVVFWIMVIFVALFVSSWDKQDEEGHVLERNLCRVARTTDYLSQLLYGASMYTLTALSIDRYIGLTKQVTNTAFVNLNRGKIKRRCNREAVSDAVKVASVWLTSALLAVPTVIPAKAIINSDAFNTTITKTTGQSNVWTDFGLCPLLDPMGIAWYKFVVYGIVPVILMAVFYCAAAYRLFHSQTIRGNEEQVKQRKKSARSLLILSIVVCFCVLPSPVISLINFMLGGFHEVLVRIAMSLFARIMIYVNLFLSPVILCLIAEKYRVMILGILKKKSVKAPVAVVDASAAAAKKSETKNNDEANDSQFSEEKLSSDDA